MMNDEQKRQHRNEQQRARRKTAKTVALLQKGAGVMQERHARTTADPVNSPAHYRQHPSGIECIQVTEHLGFCVGNAIKYLWRAGLKGGTSSATIQDLEKARWYIAREIDRITRTDGK